MFTPSRELELRNSVCSLHVLLCASARPIVLDVCERSTCTSDQAFRVSAHASFMYTLYWSKLCAPASYRSQARTVHEHTTCAQVVQALRASSRPRPRVLDLRGQSVCNALLLRSTSAKAQTVLGLDETSAAPTSSARVSHAMADTIDTSSAAVQGRGCMEIGINTTSSGGTCIHSVRILGPYARCTAEKISLERAAQLSFLKSYFIRVFVNANRSADPLTYV